MRPGAVISRAWAAHLQVISRDRRPAWAHLPQHDNTARRYAAGQTKCEKGAAEQSGGHARHYAGDMSAQKAGLKRCGAHEWAVGRAERDKLRPDQECRLYASWYVRSARGLSGPTPSHLFV